MKRNVAINIPKWPSRLKHVIMNTIPTNFCFNSTGYFNIVSDIMTKGGTEERSHLLILAAIPATPVGPGRICCTKVWDFSVRCRTWMLSSWRCRWRSPTSCCTRCSSASRAAVVPHDTVSGTRATADRWWCASEPCLEACSFWRSTTNSCSNLAFSATVSSSFYSIN